jgi:hypothetical protein
VRSVRSTFKSFGIRSANPVSVTAPGELLRAA